jgi:hypothetical protein
MKLESLEVVDGKTRRRYAKPVTPYERVLASQQVSALKKVQLQQLKERLNPFELERQIQKQLLAINKVRRALE